MTDKFDVVVVGAGLAGSAAAYAAARAGLQVILAERGTRPGSKTVSGGLLYAHGLARMFPKFWEEEPSPVERAIDRNVLSLLTPDQALSIDHFDRRWGSPPYNAFSVLRSRLDPWLAGKAEAAGATPVYGVKVDGLVREGSRVVGISAGGDELRADVVILADGVNAILGRRGALEPEAEPRAVGVGVKQVIELPSGEVEKRFQLAGRSGTQYTTVGFPPKVSGGGFLYTNRDSLSIGMILNMRSLVEADVMMYDVLEAFKQHPFVARLLEGGSLAEYSGCFVTEGGFDALPPLSGDGYLLAGAAAGFFLNTGFTLRGMDFAIESGRIAGETAAAAVRAKDPSAAFLARYGSALEESFVLRELRAFRGYPGAVENPRLYSHYPVLAANLLSRLYSVDGSGRPHLASLLFETARGGPSPATLVRDLWKTARTL